MVLSNLCEINYSQVNQRSRRVGGSLTLDSNRLLRFERGLPRVIVGWGEGLRIGRRVLEGREGGERIVSQGDSTTTTLGEVADETVEARQSASFEFV